MNKAIFIDRDGTLNDMVYDPVHGTLDSPRRPEQVKLMAGAGEFLKRMRDAGYLIILTTNQPGVAKGTLTQKDLDSVNDRLAQLLEKEGGKWDDARICPHHPDFDRVCECRKPLPGLIVDAAKAHDIDLGKSWMIGDGLVDVQAGRAARCRTILVVKLKLYHVSRFFDMNGSEPDAIAQDLREAAEIILGNRKSSPRKE